ncbi:AraC-type DNA-binding protein [Paenibacillus sp. yr247]|uniref:AraC family transcriptional regulator n=1 Tax=Paenibacillus sp. yr247 TaxID=1761880 RepID=UPI0008884886|nr:AraC family transcriptional regulator [Paenibacillus sp. yr247]SDP20349.1 AraC-type DNA-binding protein [Paenibacillus sp. yr247]
MSDQKLGTLLEESVSIRQEALDQLIAMSERITTAEGRTQTIIPFLTIFRKSLRTTPIPELVTPSFCILLQGTKKLHFGRDLIHYHPGDYFASLIDIPASANIIDATKKPPYIGLRINLTTKEIASVVMEAEISMKPRDNKLTAREFFGKSDADLLDLLMRLLKLIDKPKEARFLSALIKREMIFHLLSRDKGHLFFQQAILYQQADGVSNAIEWIKNNYARSFTVEELAKSINMSLSGLHHKFKAITTMSPLQYQKLLRLQEARRLMLSGSMDVTTAACEVGYDSPSQFNREYRRLFGLPPLQDIKTVRESSIADSFKNR